MRQGCCDSDVDEAGMLLKQGRCLGRDVVKVICC